MKNKKQVSVGDDRRSEAHVRRRRKEGGWEEMREREGEGEGRKRRGKENEREGEGEGRRRRGKENEIRSGKLIASRPTDRPTDRQSGF